MISPLSESCLPPDFYPNFQAEFEEECVNNLNQDIELLQLLYDERLQPAAKQKLSNQLSLAKDALIKELYQYKRQGYSAEKMKEEIRVARLKLLKVADDIAQKDENFQASQKQLDERIQGLMKKSEVKEPPPSLRLTSKNAERGKSQPAQSPAQNRPVYVAVTQNEERIKELEKQHLENLCAPFRKNPPIAPTTHHELTQAIRVSQVYRAAKEFAKEQFAAMYILLKQRELGKIDQTQYDKDFQELFAAIKKEGQEWITEYAKGSNLDLVQ